MPQVTEQVKKTVQDAAYIAVGVGVLGAQQAQERLGATARDAAGEIRERVEPVLAKLEARVEPILGSIEARVEPVVDTARVKAKQWLARRKPATTRKAA
jgi:hypothetical protein